LSGLHRRPFAERILEFLVLNRDFPHAIRYCVDNIRTAIESIQRTGGRRSPDEFFAGVGKLHAMLGYTTIHEILSGDAAAFLHNIASSACAFTSWFTVTMCNTPFNPRWPFE
jgi:uncharacterized alpha-E superfamily protein